MTKFRMLTINTRGLSMNNKFVQFCRVIAGWARAGILNGACVQEHNLDQATKALLIRIAADFKLHLTIGFSKTACHRGGTLILMDMRTVQHVKTIHEDPNLARSAYEFNATPLDVASVYAPADPTKRMNFFSHIKSKLSKHTIAGGDWNCVPDVILDVKGKNQLNYPNRGASQLATVMADLGLDDYRRRQLEDEFEHTRKPDNGTSAVITRLDRWYIPTDTDFADFLWDIHVRNDLVWSEENSDHQPVLLTVEPIEGERGHDRETIREDLVYLPTVQAQLLILLEKAYDNNKSIANKWSRAMIDIRDYLMKETAKLKKKERTEIKHLKQELAVLNHQINAEGPTGYTTQIEKRLKEELYKLENPTPPHLARVGAAKNMTDKSEACTLPFFKTYKDASKQSWINEQNTYTWKEGEEPEVEGTEKSPDRISDELAKYYKMLLSAKTTSKRDRDNILCRLRKQAINPKSARNLDTDVEDEEVAEIMDSLPLGKQPGPNRIPNAVFRCLSSAFAPKLAAVIRAVLNGTGKMPKHMMEGDITVMYKKKSRLDPRNYRPLTMLNTDYKIYTKILANRMKTVVHEFVSSMQKGFVPDVFIAECSMALTLIENYINEKPLERKGAFLFLDMEKAFDRVSYSFLTESLAELGFGPRFRRGVEAMYNPEKSPRRRVLANGYYSDWFPISSGVAQGCPLSPLLFLVVAESLKISLDMQKKFKGMYIGGKYFKLSQFADDTTLILGSMEELEHAEEGILRWCRATGMKENKSKREGLAMGMYRQQHMAPEYLGPRQPWQIGIDWKSEGDWATSLGVPIGNDLDGQKWWSKKLESVRDKSKKWTALFRTGYFGRNLVVQAMFLGRLRYWLYSVPMSKKMCATVQDDADILWWSKEPLLGAQPKRFRRCVSKKTCSGPRVMGGLGNVDWAAHVQSFMSQWITRYVDPSTSQWKDILDALLIFREDGSMRYPEGRGVFFSNLTSQDKTNILATLPKKATYIKDCIRAHFKLDIKQAPPKEDFPDTLPAEPLWRNHRFSLLASSKERKYYSEQLGLKRLGDLVHPKTRRVRTADQWLSVIRRRGREPHTWTDHAHEHAAHALGDDPEEDAAVERANRLHQILNDIKPGIKAWTEVHMRVAEPRREELRAMMGADGWRYGTFDREDDQGDSYHMYSRNQVGKLTDLDTHQTYPRHQTFSVSYWKVDKTDFFGEGEIEERVLGPVHQTFPHPEGWEIDGDEVRLDQLSIRIRTRLQAVRKMKPPTCEERWVEPGRLPMTIPWRKIWRIRTFYASPRDQLTWLKVMHRNLYLAGNSEDDNSCLVCDDKENVIHLVRCKTILTTFWDRIARVMQRMGFHVPSGKLEYEAFWLLGRMDQTSAVGPEQAGIMFIAWRCLYAAIVHSRVEKVSLDLEHAYNRIWQMTITRLRAEGEKWNLWHRLNHHSGKKSYFPKKFQQRTVMSLDEKANYWINPEILAEYDKTKPSQRRVPPPKKPKCPPPLSPPHNHPQPPTKPEPAKSLLTEDLSSDSDMELDYSSAWRISTTPDRLAFTKRARPPADTPSPPRKQTYTVESPNATAPTQSDPAPISTRSSAKRLRSPATPQETRKPARNL